MDEIVTHTIISILRVVVTEVVARFHERFFPFISADSVRTHSDEATDSLAALA